MSCRKVTIDGTTEWCDELITKLDAERDQLRASLEQLQDYVGEERFRSEFQTISDMRDELEKLRAENAAAVNTAGDAIGTDLSLRNAACVEVLADAYRRAKAERDALREKVKAARREALEEAAKIIETCDECAECLRNECEGEVQGCLEIHAGNIRDLAKARQHTSCQDVYNYKDNCAKLAAALKRVEELEEANRWRKWPEEKPSKHDVYQVYDEDNLGYSGGQCSYEPDGTWWWFHTRTRIYPTHWRPITPPTV